MTSTLTNQRRVFKACLRQTERDSDDVTRKISPLDFTRKDKKVFYIPVLISGGLVFSIKILTVNSTKKAYTSLF